MGGVPVWNSRTDSSTLMNNTCRCAFSCFLLQSIFFFCLSYNLSGHRSGTAILIFPLFRSIGHHCQLYHIQADADRPKAADHPPGTSKEWNVNIKTELGLREDDGHSPQLPMTLPEWSQTYLRFILISLCCRWTWALTLHIQLQRWIKGQPGLYKRPNKTRWD